jgi:hypothetical protein
MLRVRQGSKADLMIPPDNSASSGAGAEQALFMEARRRRRRRWRAGIAAVLMTAAVVAVSAVTWLPRAFDQATGRAGTTGATPAGQSSASSGRARITYRVTTAGVPEGYGTDDITFSGKNQSGSVSFTLLARGPSPAQTHSGTERIVDGQVYDYSRVHGRLTWVHVPDPSYLHVKISDPRTLLHVLERLTRFQARGDQVIGGVRLTVLHAADPGRLTRRALLPAVFTSGQPVASLDVWADRHGVVHRVAFTFRAAAAARIMVSKAVSKAALRNYRRAERALARTAKREPESRFRLAQHRFDQAMMHAFPVRRGAQVTTTTVTFSAIGQPQHITAPQDAVSYRQFLRPASPR